MWWQVAVAVLAGLLLLWLGLVAALYLVGRRYGEPIGYKDVLRLLPTSFGSCDGSPLTAPFPVGCRIRLVVLAAYLILPVDLVPDFIPVVGYADDAILVALVLRSVARAAGPEALDRHWPGTPQSLTAVKRLIGVAS